MALSTVLAPAPDPNHELVRSKYRQALAQNSFQFSHETIDKLSSEALSRLLVALPSSKKIEVLTIDEWGRIRSKIAVFMKRPLDNAEKLSSIAAVLEGMAKVDIKSLTINLNCTEIFKIFSDLLQEKLDTVPERLAFWYAVDNQMPTVISNFDNEVKKLYEVFSFKGSFSAFETLFKAYLEIKDFVEPWNDLKQLAQFLTALSGYNLQIHFCPKLKREDREYSGTIFTVNCTENENKIVAHGESYNMKEKENKLHCFEVTTELPTIIEICENKNLSSALITSIKITVFYVKSVEEKHSQMAVQLWNRFRTNGYSAHLQQVDTNRRKKVLFADKTLSHMVFVNSQGSLSVKCFDAFTPHSNADSAYQIIVTSIVSGAKNRVL